MKAGTTPRMPRSYKLSKLVRRFDKLCAGHTTPMCLAYGKQMYHYFNCAYPTSDWKSVMPTTTCDIVLTSKQIAKLIQILWVESLNSLYALKQEAYGFNIAWRWMYYAFSKRWYLSTKKQTRRYKQKYHHLYFNRRENLRSRIGRLNNTRPGGT